MTPFEIKMIVSEKDIDHLNQRRVSAMGTDIAEALESVKGWP